MIKGTRRLVGEVLKPTGILGVVSVLMLLDWRLRGEVDWLVLLMLGGGVYLLVRIVQEHNAAATNDAPSFQAVDRQGEKGQ
jgi:hypothetical protein